MKTIIATATTIVALAALAPANSANAQDARESIFHPGDAIPWSEPDDGVRYGALFGDMTSEGHSFVFRLEVQPGFELRPHTHPVTEHLTVLSGRFYVGLGETMDREAATAYGPGSYIAIAAGAPAYMWAEEATVIQVHGVGPMTTEFLTPGESFLTPGEESPAPRGR